MTQTSVEILITLGCLLLLGLLTSFIAQKTFLPRVTLLVIFGVIFGQEVLNLLPQILTNNFAIITDITLIMVGFLLGGKLTFTNLKHSAKEIVTISLMAAVVTTMFVIAGLYLIGMPLPLAIILGCIAAATAPEVILDVINEKKYKTKFSRSLVSIVALDDIWALILFAIGLSTVKAMTGISSNGETLYLALYDIFGAIILGISIGIPAVFLTGRLKAGEPLLAEAVAVVFICGGLAMYFHVSYLITAMTVGVLIVNFARHHRYPFHAIEGIESLLMVIFFIIAGAQLQLTTLTSLTILGLFYIVLRSSGKIVGAYLGSHLSQSSTATKHNMGIALLPQAGVAIGMALVAANIYQEQRQTLLTIVIGSTIIFEIIGPIFTRIALQKTIDKN